MPRSRRGSGQDAVGSPQSSRYLAGMSAFPFRTLRLYRVKKGFTSMRSNDEFQEGQRLTYTESTLNHYDGIEICSFKDFDTGAKLVLHADDIMLGDASEYFEEVPFPR